MLDAAGLFRTASNALGRARTPSRRIRRVRPPRLEVGPPFLGGLLTLLHDRLFLLGEAAKVPGGICEVAVAARDLVVISSPSAAHEVLVAKADAFVKGTAYAPLKFVVGEGLLTSEQAVHKRQRKLMAPAFTQKRIASYADTMVSLTEHAQASWADGSKVDVADEMMRLTLAIVSQTLFGAEVSEVARVVSDSVTLLLHAVNSKGVNPLSSPFHWPTPANSRARRAKADLDRVIGTIIHQHREASAQVKKSPSTRADLLTMLLAAREEGTDVGMTDAQLRDEVMTIFLAGHETTANALTWALDLLGRNEAVRARLVSEVDATLGSRPATVADLPRLSFTLQVLKEAMRLYPAAYLISRTASRDVEIGGYTIAAGTDVLLNIYGMHREPSLFKDPEDFAPDRFALEDAMPRGAYLPFGAGPRVCIGNHFALMEGQLILATLARHMDLRAEGPAPVPDPVVTLRPRGTVSLLVERRHRADAVPNGGPSLNRAVAPPPPETT